MELSALQERAVFCDTGDIIVSAAAGSGKTRVLTERVIRLAREGADISRLLVVTFTDAAAREMRYRVFEGLSKLGDSKESLRQSLRLADAHITTIHAFCAYVAREYFYAADVDPAFRVADGDEVRILKREALNKALEAAYEEADEDFTDLACSFGKITDDMLVETITRLFEFASASPNPYIWLIEAANEARKDLPETKAYKYFLEYIETTLNDAADMCRRLEREFASDTGKAAQKNAAACNRDAEILSSAARDIGRPADAQSDGRVDSLRAALDFRFSPISWQGCENIDAEYIKSVRKKYIQEPIKALKEKALYKSYDALLEDSCASGRLVAALSLVAANYGHLYDEEKRLRNCVDYDDLGRMCATALLNPAVLEDIRSRFDEVLIDEYQDVNPAQDAILKTVSRLALGCPNRFIVGDVKQSIYRFRMAEPSLFVENCKNFKTVIRLNENYRSCESVIGAVNALFGRLMNGRLGDVAYSEAERMVCVGANMKQSDEYRAEIAIYKKSPKDQEDDDIDELEALEAEAVYVARRIGELIGSFIIGGAGARYNDIAILLRSPGTSAYVFEKALRARGIPVSVTGGARFFDTYEVKLALSLLKIADNPRRDIPLIAIMHSGVFGFTAGELAEIRVATDSVGFHDAVEGYPESGRLYIRIGKFLENLESWRDIAIALPVGEAVWRILTESGLYDFFSGDVRARANIEALSERARSFAAYSRGGLFAFNKYIEGAEGESSRDAESQPSGNNAVRIMSVHASKGLEFPIVFICALGKKFNKTDLREPYLWHRDLGVGGYAINRYMVRSNTCARFAIAQKLTGELLSEELRVLYVAATRARDKLFLVGTIKKDTALWGEDIPQSVLERAQCPLDWILAAADESVLTITNIYENKSKDLKAEPEKGCEAGGEAPDAVVINASPLSNIPAKMSVTEIKRAYYAAETALSSRFANEEHFESALARPDFLSESESFDPAAKGIATHAVLERLDLGMERTSEAVSKYIFDMEERGYIRSGDAKRVDVKAIIAFLDSDLAARMRLSKRVTRERRFVFGMPPGDIYGEIEGAGEAKVLIHGVIDCYFEEDGLLTLVDYKTDAVKSLGAKTTAEKYRRQMELYKRAVERAEDLRVGKVIVYFVGADMAVELMGGENTAV